jgi:choline dehydrogenase-like flavoprotein
MTNRQRDSCHRFLDPTAQRLYEGTVSEGVKMFDETFLDRSRVRVYGGTTNCWGGWTRTLQTIDFTRPALGGPWPIGRDDLDPFYEQALELCSLRAKPKKPNDFPLSAYDDAAWWVGKTTSTVEPIQFQPGAPVRSGVLTVVSRDDVLDHGLDFQITWGPEIERAPNITLMRNANVLYLDRDGANVRRAVCASVDAQGRRKDFTITASTFVLAAGGVETPRLMLLSDLPNPSNTLGKGFMIHPVTDWPSPGARFRPGRVRVPGAVTTFYRGTNLQGGSFPTGVHAVLIPTDQALQAEPIGNFRAMVDFGAGTVNFNWQQALDDRNTITLSQTKKDFLGMPEIDLTWQLYDADYTSVRRAVALVGKALTDIGYASDYADTIDYKNPNFLMGDHPMGATRMGATPTTGVVDADCRVNGTDNLFIASSSVFPSGGWSNPTLTIVALSLRLADYLSA